ncbi:MAG: Hsp20/alpha crystallin family protein [Verrucomicrobiales bacterium]
MNSTVATQNNNQAANQQQQRSLSRGYLHPQVNIIENKDSYTLEAEMPGVNKEGLEVSLEGNELTIIGRRSFAVEGAQCVYRESAQRDYRRSFELDPAIDTSKITARMENGILLLDLPKAEQVKPRKIQVD